MGDIAVRVEGLGKCFKLNIVPNLTLEEAVHRRIGRLKSQLNAISHDIASLQWPQPNRYLPQPRQDFWALRDISFELNHGEVMGIVGPNGAGKSTLLKILTQVLMPSEGRAELYGSVGALLEVGTGFNPELTGRENIYLYGSILGMSRADISRRFDEIVAFAEIERFLDQPIKNYSSGMHSRLAFSVAAHLECDILLVDEVLSVGDASFRDKCLGKMEEVTGQGRAVIFVSHNMSAVNNMCERGMVLRNGRIEYLGDTEDAISYYMDTVSPNKTEEKNNIYFEENSNLPAQIRMIELKNASGNAKLTYDRRESIHIDVVVDINIPSIDYYMAIIINDAKNNCLIHALDEDEKPSELSASDKGSYKVSATIPSGIFRVGKYYLTIGVGKRQDGSIDKYTNVTAFEIIDNHSNRSMRPIEHMQNLISPILDWDVVRN